MQLGVDNVAYRLYTVSINNNKCIGANMQLLKNLSEKEINTLAYKMMERAFTQMQESGDLQNADKVAEHMEDYYTLFVK